MTNAIQLPPDPKSLIAPNGFHKVDLHVHSPISFCFDPDFKGVTTEEIIDAALTYNLDAIALTDHNSAHSVDEFRRIGDRLGLAVFPGTEITTHQGHILAIFDRDAAADTIWDLLEAVGVPKGTNGDGTQRVADPMHVVIEKIAERGGLPIPAHIDRFPNGFWAGMFDRQVRQSIFSHELVDVVEITAPRDKPRWNQGTMSNFARPRAVIQDSDAHAPNELSRRPTFYRLSDLRLSDLRTAFHEHEDKVRFPHELFGPEPEIKGTLQ